MIIERLSKEHRNTERLLAVLEREIDIFAQGGRPDYEVIRSVISYFEVYPEQYHHPQEDLVFAKLKLRDPQTAAKIGALDIEHRLGTERLRRTRQLIDAVLSDREMLRESVESVIRDFIDRERHHLTMEDRHFFPAALRALTADDWSEIAAALTPQKDPLFSDHIEERFDTLRAHILALEQEAESDRL